MQLKNAGGGKYKDLKLHFKTRKDAIAELGEAKYLEKYSEIRYTEDGTIIVTDDWKDKGHISMPRIFRPNAVIETQGEGQINRTIYDEHGMKKTEIHGGDHNRPKTHPYGEHGEHAHDNFWKEDGSIKNREVGELSYLEREWHKDIL